MAGLKKWFPPAILTQSGGMAERKEVIVGRFGFGRIPRRAAVLCGAVSGMVALVCIGYLRCCPGDYIEPATMWKLTASAILYAAALSAALLLKRRWARLVYFAFPAVLAWEEALNFAPVDRYYAAYQLAFAMLAAAWCWCADAVAGELIAKRCRWLAGLPTLLLGGTLFLLPVTILAHRLTSGRKFTYDSIQAVYQTEPAEAFYYCFTHFIGIFLLLLGAAVCCGVFWLNRLGKKEPAPRGVLIATAAVTLALSPWILQEFTGREALNRTKVLFTDSLGYFDVIKSYAAGDAARLAEVEKSVEKSGDDGIYVLIIGESHSRRHSSAYGYETDTTPFLRRAAAAPDCVLMKEVYSCHVQTMQVLTMLLTARNQYEKRGEGMYPSIFDVANYCSYETVFLSNQYPHGRFDSPVAALASGAQQGIWLNTMEDFILWRARPDGALLERLPELLQGKRKLVVVHLMGSHGPYFRRYPEKFRPELEWYPYDKSILYTDTLLEKMIGMFRENPRVKAAVYVSDHSEVPGVGHAADLFEPEMTEIPMFLYLSETLRKQRSALERTLRKNAGRVFTNDLVFELMLDLMGIRHRFCTPALRIASPEYALKPEEARTLWGALPLERAGAE